MARPTLILASASPRRVALLEQVGITPDRIVPSDIDESVRAHELPRPHALRMAQAKALAVQEMPGSAGCVILSADTVVSLGRRILPKADDDRTVATCLGLLSGRRHTVMTAVAVIDTTGKMRTRICETKVAFRRLDTSEIAEYCKSQQGIGKAGGYAIQGHAAVFAKFVSGSYTNVVGLPLMETFQMLRACSAA